MGGFKPQNPPIAYATDGEYTRAAARWTDAEIYCAGFRSHRPPQTAMQIWRLAESCPDLRLRPIYGFCHDVKENPDNILFL